MHESEKGTIVKSQQDQMLKLVSKSFYKELNKYGIKQSDIVSISMHLLDLITKEKISISDANKFYNDRFKCSNVIDQWQQEKGHVAV